MPRLWSMMIPLAGLAVAIIPCGCATNTNSPSKTAAYEVGSSNYRSPYHGVIYNGYGGGWYRCDRDTRFNCDPASLAGNIQSERQN
jgi:hypothetical protein